jgi:hypothetical protein
MPAYSKCDYRNNLILYWQQYYPTWTIPLGFQVHHIVPKSVAKNKGWDDYKINHPKNLVALHSDDHISIHKNRGDKYVNGMVRLTVTMFQKGNIPWSKGKKGLVAWNKGLPKAQEAIDKHSKSMKEFHRMNPGFTAGENNGMYGWEWSDKWKKEKSEHQLLYNKALSKEQKSKKYGSAKGKKWYVFEDGTTMYAKDTSDPKFNSGLKYKNGRKWNV